jgi:chromosome partitioning protein
MGQIIVSGNLKGGTGKTTIAVNLACALGTHGYGVALLDVDPQGTAADWARRGELPLHAEATPPSGLPGRARWLQRAVELGSAADIVVLDMPPSSAAVLASALMVADLLVVPITPSAVDVPPTSDVLRLVREAREARRDGRPAALLVPNRVDPDAHYDDATREAFACLRERWAPTIHQHTEHGSAFARGVWIGAHVPGSSAANEMLALAAAVEQRLGLAASAGVSDDQDDLGEAAARPEARAASG